MLFSPQPMVNHVRKRIKAVCTRAEETRAPSHHRNVPLIPSDTELPAIMFSSWDTECLPCRHYSQLANHALQSRGAQPFGDLRPLRGCWALTTIPHENTYVPKSMYTMSGGGVRSPEGLEPHARTPVASSKVTGPTSQVAGREHYSLTENPSQKFSQNKPHIFFNKH